MTPPGAVLDTNVLVPSGIRDLLLWSAEDGLFHPHWSGVIMAELRRHLGPVARIPEDKVDRVILQMQAAFPGAMTPVWPSDRVAALTNQPKDRHVLAVAIEAEARFIVTQNLKDFRPADLDPHGIEALSADDFLLYLLHNRTRRLVNVIRGMSARLTRPPLTPIELVRALQTQAPAFAERAIIELAK